MKADFINHKSFVQFKKINSGNFNVSPSQLRYFGAKVIILAAGDRISLVSGQRTYIFTFGTSSDPFGDDNLSLACSPKLPGVQN